MEREFINESYEKCEMYTGYHDYHEHKDWHLNAPTDKRPKYFIGVELETVFPCSSDRDDFCNEFESNIMFMESDCSLPRGGCEFISVPLKPKDARNEAFWQPFIRTLSRANVRSWGYNETGLHIHISRTVFTDSQAIGRLLYMYNYIIDSSVRQRIFGRGHGEWALQMGETTKAKACKVLPEALKIKKVKDDVCNELTTAGRMDRSYQINLTNSATVEFRQGKGSVSAGRIAAVCDFVCLLCEYVNKNADMDKYSLPSFLDYIREKGIGRLIAYIDQEV